MSVTQTEQRLIRLADVSRFLPITYQRAATLAREGILPTVRLGRQIFVDRAKLDQFIDAGGKALPGGWRRESR